MRISYEHTHRYTSGAQPGDTMSAPNALQCLCGTITIGMRVLPNSLVARAAGGELPETLRPTLHLF